MKRFSSLILSGLAALSVQAIELPDIFTDNMLLQQNAQAKVWGWAAANNYVQVTTSWNGETYTVQVGEDGKWLLEVSTPAAGYTPYSIIFKEYKANPTTKSKVKPIDEVTSNGVLIGEVWFCSGQSNMEMPLGGFWNCPVEGANETIASAGKYTKAIRVATIPHDGAATPQPKVGGKWEIANTENASKFSACGYYFATTLNDMLDVPVGIINCSWGGSCVEGWLPKEILLTYPDGLVPMDDTDYHAKMIMFNGMLAPLAGYTIKGFLWNQGESNVGREKEYIERFSTMTNLWRKMWNQPGDALPIYTVELPPFRYGDPEGTAAADFRAAQHQIARQLEHSGCVCTSDLFYDYEIDQIHGCKKKEIGQRLAYLALTRDYNIKGVGSEAPEYEYMTVVDASQDDQAVIAGSAVASQNPEGCKKIAHLYFTNSTDGFDRMANIEGFEVQGEDGQWHPAVVWASSAWQNVERQGCYLSLACPGVNDLRIIRYCYKNFAIGKLHNMRGLPVVPFTTEK